MAGPGLESNLDFLDSVLALYLSKRQGMMSNEIVRNTYEFEKLCRKKVSFKGGKRLEFDTLLRRSTFGGFSSAWKVRQVEQRQHNVRGNVDGTASVANVSVANDPRWANRFCGPIGSNLNVNGANGAGALDATDTLT